MHEAKEKAIKAAEERIRIQRLLSGGGRTLGGGGVSNRAGKSPRELAAEVSIGCMPADFRLRSLTLASCVLLQAAERRLKDDRTCGVDQAKEAAKASRDGVIEINDDGDDAETPVAAPAGASGVNSDDEIQIIEPPPPPPLPVAGPSSGHTFDSKPAGALKPAAADLSARRTVPNPIQRQRLTVPSKLSAPAVSSRFPTTSSVDGAAPVDVWPCPACTLDNVLGSSSCAICDGPRPALSVGQKAHLQRAGWTCTSCGQTEIGTEWWTCVTAGCPGARGWS